MEIENLYLPVEIKCKLSDGVIHSHRMSTVDETKYSRFNSDFDLETEDYLGSGVNGLVVRCNSRLDLKTYAIKKISVFVNDDELTFAELMREAIILSKFNNPAIVRYHSIWIEPTFVGITEDPEKPAVHPVETDQPCLYIQQELCDCTLKKKMEDEALTLQKCANFFLKTAEGLEHIHSRNIMHGDIKAANIFFRKGQLKIGDFGLAREIGDGDNEILARPSYGPPDDLVNAKADVFSLGILLVEMLLNITGGPKASEVIPMLTQQREAELPDSWPDGLLKKWVMRMLEKEPSQRPSSSEIVEKKLEIKDAILEFRLEKKRKVQATAIQQIEGMKRKHTKRKNVKGNRSKKQKV